MVKPKWEPLTVWDNVDAAVRHFGLSQVGVVWGLAQIRYESVEERDALFRYLTKGDANA